MSDQDTKKGRRSVRLQHYDYAQAGSYFITICSFRRQNLFSKIVAEVSVLNSLGELVRDEWLRTISLRDFLEPDVYVIMPNHFHAIVSLVERSRGTPQRAQEPRRFGRGIPSSLASIVGKFKAAVTRRARLVRGDPSLSVWQRGYYEHVIRNEDDLLACRQYVVNNPLKWHLDKYHSMN